MCVAIARSIECNLWARRARLWTVLVLWYGNQSSQWQPAGKERWADSANPISNSDTAGHTWNRFTCQLASPYVGLFWLHQLLCPRTDGVKCGVVVSAMLNYLRNAGPNISSSSSFFFVNSKEIFIWGSRIATTRSSTIRSIVQTVHLVCGNHSQGSLIIRVLYVDGIPSSRMTSRRNWKGLENFLIYYFSVSSHLFSLFLFRLEHHLSLDPPLCQ